MINKSEFNFNVEKFLDNFTNIDEIVQHFDEKIRKYRKEIDEDPRRSSFDHELKTKCQQLTEKITRTRTLRKELESFLDCDEIKQLLEYHKIWQQQQIVFDQIQLLDDFQNRFDKIQNLLDNSKELANNCEYNKAHGSIVESIDLYDKLVKDGENLFEKLPSPFNYRQKEIIEKSLKKLNTKIISTKEELLYDMIQLFKRNLYFENYQEQDSNVDNRIFHFDFIQSMSLEQYESFIDCILEERYDFLLYFKNIFDQLNNHFTRKILENNKKAISTSDGIHLIDGDCDNSNDVIENLEKFIEIILNQFTMNNQLKQSRIFKKFIGQLWSEQLFKCVIDYYFETQLPKCESELANFLELLQQGSRLEKKLQSYDMIDDEESEILRTYRENIKNHFSTKLCQDFIIRMKRLLKKPMETISSKKLLQSLSLEEKSKFSDCLISDYMLSVKQLFEVCFFQYSNIVLTHFLFKIQEMSALLSNSSKNLSLLLSETIYLTCELFIAIAPYRYRELIEQDAKENAIFHNNCLMFGHLMECMALTHKPYLDSLFELLPSIRNVGSQIFLNQMRYQERTLYRYINNETFIQSLQEIVNETPRTDLRISSQSHFEFRECLNNCLKHLNCLQNSFSTVLSMKIYNKIMSTLLQTLMNQFIEKILSMNDISSLGSSHLYNEIDYFCKELKLFLIDSEDVIFKWMKLNEINFLLKVSSIFFSLVH